MAAPLQATGTPDLPAPAASFFVDLWNSRDAALKVIYVSFVALFLIIGAVLLAGYRNIHVWIFLLMLVCLCAAITWYEICDNFSYSLTFMVVQGM